MSLPAMKCSVSSVYLDDITINDNDENGEGRSSPPKVKRMFPKKLLVPQFTGYDQVATYPLKEDYSKWILTIFKPWRNDPESLKVDGVFSKALELYIWNENIPRRICMKIVRRKMRYVTDCSDDILFKSDIAHSPTEAGGRRNDEHDLCFDMNDDVDVGDFDIDSDL
eukprot:5132634-Ditylum_brightwellii.AAC.1